MLSKFLKNNSLNSTFAESVNQFYIPLSDKIVKDYYLHTQQHNTPFFIGINGCQGSGKSTLADFMALYIQQHHNLSVVVLSLDDFYLAKQQRQQLAQQYHPLFETRGVPGTHDVSLIKKVLTQLKGSKESTETISIPRFNKALDLPFPQQTWPIVSSNVDIVLFEGWCWGVTAESVDDLIKPVNEFEVKYDPQGIWRKTVNQALLANYQSLYSFMDSWIMLKAPSFEIVYQWRLEQEKKLAQKFSTENIGNNSIMSAEQIAKFIQHFQRLTERSLIQLPEKVNVLFELDSNRNIIASRGLC